MVKHPHNQEVIFEALAKPFLYSSHKVLYNTSNLFIKTPYMMQCRAEQEAPKKKSMHHERISSPILYKTGKPPFHSEKRTVCGYAGYCSERKAKQKQAIN